MHKQTGCVYYGFVSMHGHVTLTFLQGCNENEKRTRLYTALDILLFEV